MTTIERYVSHASKLAQSGAPGRVIRKIFRIGHLGEINELTLIGALSGVEMGLSLADVPHQKGGVAQAMAYLTKTAEG